MNKWCTWTEENSYCKEGETDPCYPFSLEDLKDNGQDIDLVFESYNDKYRDGYNQLVHIYDSEIQRINSLKIIRYLSFQPVVFSLNYSF